MGMYHECPYCHASLDFGERCDCQNSANSEQAEKNTNAENSEGKMADFFYLVDKYVSEPTFSEIVSAILPAQAKLKRIIEREGDADGARFNPSYFAQLIAENIRSARMTKKCLESFNEKRRVAEANTPLLTRVIVSH